MDNQLTLSTTGGEQSEHVEALLRWLSREPELRGRCKAVGHAPSPGEMGSWVDFATVAVGGGGALSVLAMSLKTWFAQPRRSDVEIEIRSPDGRSVTVNAKRVNDVPALLQSVLDVDSH
ncbi:effector-associated constant component EACC1 [Nocardia asiatica]|uniref:effector-associated constant component EACC1 n=1 Tax=Nocardia asiatica TaxID=209252 RepID=UPI003570F335